LKAGRGSGDRDHGDPNKFRKSIHRLRPMQR
jgi:hypothetical protein